MPLQATSGAATYDAFGGGAAVAANYIEDMFQTWLYTGNGSTQTITNGIDLSGKGGLVWSKNRTQVDNNRLYDTVRGTNNVLISNSTSAALADSSTVIAFNSNGYSIGTSGNVNFSGDNFVSWTFREQQKFFDVVTWIGNGSQPRTITHNLGSVPGCIIVKRTDTPSDWAVYHRAVDPITPQGYRLELNTTSERVATTSTWNNQAPTSTEFYIGSATYNGSGNTYVAYLFAHNAGGFGLTGTDNVISCGSYTGTGAVGNAINLGYEAQWVMIKRTDADGYDWNMFDVMRGMSLTGSSRVSANTSAAEINSTTPIVSPTATGFSLGATTAAFNGDGGTYIYIAIRRGPMRTPTTGTQVFSAKTYSATTSSAEVTHDVTFDAEMNANRDYSGGAKFLIVDSLRGINGTAVWTANTGAEVSYPTYWSRKDQRTMYAPSAFDGWWASNSGTQSHISYGLVRAPGFFDEVCYTGTGSARTVTHNLAAVPQLMLVKQRTASPVGTPFAVYSATMGNTGIMFLNSDGGNQGPDTQWNSTTPTASVFSVGSSLEVNQSGSTYVAYLFASCPGVSRVGSYTGTGTTQVIDCGFTAGSRFVMIKRVGTGDWYVWDSARGIVAGNDPYLLLNSTAAEVTNTDFVDTAATGFEISSTAPAAINANGGTFIFLAIA